MAKQIGALWLKETDDGRKYLSGVLRDLRGDINIVVFKNTFKEKEDQPDYHILLSEPKKEKAEDVPEGAEISDEEEAFF